MLFSGDDLLKSPIAESAAKVVNGENIYVLVAKNVNRLNTQFNAKCNVIFVTATQQTFKIS